VGYADVEVHLIGFVPTTLIIPTFLDEAVALEKMVITSLREIFLGK